MLGLGCLAALPVFAFCSTAVQAQTPLTSGTPNAHWGYRTAYADAGDASSANRVARNALFDGLTVEPPFSAASTPHKLNYPPSFDRMERVPLSLADAVIVGTVVGGNTYLSNDQRAFYTEAVVHVDQVLSNTSGLLLDAVSQIAVLRAGGVVAVTPGDIIVRGCPTESQPRGLHQYVFLLKSRPQAAAFALVSGFELDGNQVYILESVAPGPQRAVLGQYGTNANSFVQMVADMVSAPQQ